MFSRRNGTFDHFRVKQGLGKARIGKQITTLN